MSNRIELKKSYVLKNESEILSKINNWGYVLNEKTKEQDTYYTDKNLIFIKDRTCLRLRKTNDTELELTFKPKSSEMTEKYGKKEVNIQLNIKDFEDTKFVLNNLGYKEYVEFTKNRRIYTKIIDGFEHNIMIDKIDNVGSFIEFEILFDENTNEEMRTKELKKFISEFECDKLKEKNKPYRDLIKEIKNNN